MADDATFDTPTITGPGNKYPWGCGGIGDGVGSKLRNGHGIRFGCSVCAMTQFEKFAAVTYLSIKKPRFYLLELNSSKNETVSIYVFKM